MSDQRPAVATYQRGEDFWANYLKGRPHIPQSYFDAIFDYHAKHGAGFGVAHDAGTGPGLHVPRLLQRFNHIILSDPYESNLDTAKAKLTEQGDKYTFVQSSLEDTVNTQPAGTVDLVFCQAMWHFVKPDEAVAAVAHQLRPGGTFAVSSVGTPVFTDPRVWEIALRIFRTYSSIGISKAGGPYGPTRPVVRASLSRLDSVPIKPEFFEPGALRIKMKDPLGPGRDHAREVVPVEYLEAFPHWSLIGEADVVKEAEVTEEWTAQVDFEVVKAIMLTYPHDDKEEPYASIWKEMKELVGDGKTQVVWPYSLVLATRRS